MVEINKIQAGRKYAKVGFLAVAVLFFVIISGLIFQGRKITDLEEWNTPFFPSSETPIPVLNQNQLGNSLELVNKSIFSGNYKSFVNLPEGYSDITLASGSGEMKVFSKNVDNGSRRVVLLVEKVDVTVEQFALDYVKHLTNDAIEQGQLFLQSKKVIRMVFVSNDNNILLALNFIPHGTSVYIVNVNQDIDDSTNLDLLKKELTAESDLIVRNYDFPHIFPDEIEEAEMLGVN